MKAKPSLKNDLLFNWIRPAFSIDLRSLAIFRILIGLVIVIDLICRLGDVALYYSDQGVLPREVMLNSARPWFSFSNAANQIAPFWKYNFHLLSGEVWWQYLLLGIMILFGIL